MGAQRKVALSGVLAGCLAAAIVAVVEWSVHRGHGGDVHHGRQRAGRRVRAHGAIRRRPREADNRRTGAADRHGASAHQLVVAVFGLWWLTNFQQGFIVKDIFDWFASGIGIATDAIKTLIASAMRWLWQQVVSLVGDVQGWASELIYGVAELARQLVGDLSTWAQEAVYGVAELARGLVADLWAALNAAVGILQSGLNDVLGWIERAGEIILGVIYQWWSVVWADAIAPFVGWVEGAAETVGRWISDAIGALYRDVIAPILSGLSWLLDRIPAIWDWLIGEVHAGWHVIAAAWDWLVWMSEHAFAEFYDLLTARSTPGAELQRAMQHADAEGWVNTLGDVIDRVFS